jgi:iron complex outermembrane recepter protein
MSELINTNDSRATIRWKLLTSASALALTAAVSCSGLARAEDTDHPQIWVELGGQMENVTGQGEVFAPPFLAANSDSSVLWTGVTPLEAQKPATFSFGEEGRISFQPEGSDWVFSAAALIGRSSNFRHVHHQTYETFVWEYKYGVRPPAENPRGINNFSDTTARHSESHNILDFQAGKDVGLGIFGKDSSSTLSFGVRIAQFTSSAAFSIRARPNLQFYDKYISALHLGLHLPYFHTYYATGKASRSFRGIGPSLSWNGSTPFAGNAHDGELAVDWGVNAALLFGKQKARVQHQESSHYVMKQWVFAGGYYSGYHAVPPARITDRSLTVPNVGGFAGVSWRVQDFKVSMGYRADFFFGAMDTGIDARRNSNAAFNGPYASISVGIGD